MSDFFNALRMYEIRRFGYFRIAACIVSAISLLLMCVLTYFDIRAALDLKAITDASVTAYRVLFYALRLLPFIILTVGLIRSSYETPLRASVSLSPIVLLASLLAEHFAGGALFGTQKSLSAIQIAFFVCVFAAALCVLLCGKLMSVPLLPLAGAIRYEVHLYSQSPQVLSPAITSLSSALFFCAIFLYCVNELYLLFRKPNPRDVIIKAELDKMIRKALSSCPDAEDDSCGFGRGEKGGSGDDNDGDDDGFFD